MKETWRTLLESRGGVPPEAEPLAGDVGLLVPVQPDWVVLDLTGGQGSRGAAIAGWARHTSSTVTRVEDLQVLAARRSGNSSNARFSGLVVDEDLPFKAGTVDLILLEDGSPWPLARVRSLLRPEGYLVWLIRGAPLPDPDRSTGAGKVRWLVSVVAWFFRRLGVTRHWRSRLAEESLTLSAAYVHARGYVWSYLPFESARSHRYYLEALQEEGVGETARQARFARWMGLVGLYRYLVSAYVVVARA